MNGRPYVVSAVGGFGRRPWVGISDAPVAVGLREQQRRCRGGPQVSHPRPPAPQRHHGSCWVTRVCRPDREGIASCEQPDEIALRTRTQRERANESRPPRIRNALLIPSLPGPDPPTPLGFPGMNGCFGQRNSSRGPTTRCVRFLEWWAIPTNDPFSVRSRNGQGVHLSRRERPRFGGLGLLKATTSGVGYCQQEQAMLSPPPPSTLSPQAGPSRR